MRAWEINKELLREPIIDIGAGKLPLNVPGLHVRAWDKEDGDAHSMVGVADGSYKTVFSHHCLEHLEAPISALRVWGRILANGGHLIVTVPHRDLYEKKPRLPSLFNPDHKTFWLPDRAEPPNTFSLLDSVRLACPELTFVSLQVLAAGYLPMGLGIHPQGDFHIEIVMRK